MKKCVLFCGGDKVFFKAITIESGCLGLSVTCYCYMGVVCLGCFLTGGGRSGSSAVLHVTVIWGGFVFVTCYKHYEKTCYMGIVGSVLPEKCYYYVIIRLGVFFGVLLKITAFFDFVKLKFRKMGRLYGTL